MKRILVTGGAGFIGSYVASALAERGDKVFVVDDFNNGLYDPALKYARVSKILKPLKIAVEKLDILDQKKIDQLISKHRINSICHLAAWAGVRTSLAKPWMYERVNITGTRHIFECAVNHKIGYVVYASSSSVYGANTKKPFSEADRVDQPLAPYALSKRTNELQAYYFNRLYGLKSVGLRFFTVYGPWGRPDMAIFKFTNAILRDEPILIHNFGKMKRDFTYIDDVVWGVVAAIDKIFNCDLFNLGGSDPVELERLIRILEKTIGKRAKKKLVAMQPGEVEQTSADVSKAKKMLGFNPKVRVEEGIPRFWQWYKGYYHA